MVRSPVVPAAGGSRLSRLVVGFDGSDAAKAAAAFALSLARKAESEVTVVHAAPAPETAASAALAAAATDQVAAYEREWHRRLDDLRRQSSEDVAVECRVVHGSPAGVLVAAAAEAGADLILVGSHGVGPIRGALLGSVSSQVLAHASCSVMVVRAGEETAPTAQGRTIVAGIDGSPSSRAALEVAQALAAGLGARLVLVHAYDPHIPFAVMTTEGIKKELRRHGDKVLGAARDVLTAPVDVAEEVVEGYARHALVAACERHAPALLVVGDRGLGGFRELLLGSTSHWVANHAPCPVVIARTPRPAARG